MVIRAPVPRGATRPARWKVGLVALGLVSACSDTPPAPHDPEPTDRVRTFADGPILYLERARGVDTLRLALDTRWGGTVVELSLNGVNVINASDPGRELQVAFYDGDQTYDACAGCTGNWGWDPVQGGDLHGRGSTVIDWSLAGDSVYVRTRPLEWYPDDKGGGPGLPIESDVLVEQWVAAVRDHFRAFRVRYRVTHLGDDRHAAAGQEVPAVYANLDYDRIVYYAGATPWANAPVTVAALGVLGGDLGPERRMSEHWASLVNGTGDGVTVYMPGSYPFVNGFVAPGSPGPTGTGTTYFRSVTPFGFDPADVREAEVFVIAGHHVEARGTVYALRTAGTPPDVLAPLGHLDAPANDATVAGLIDVAGWALDNTIVAAVVVQVDGAEVGTAAYGLERADVQAAYPGAPLATGYEYRLDTAALSNGTHTVRTLARDAAGNTLMRAAVVTVAN